MRSCTRFLGGKKFESVVAGRRIVTDQPVADGGEGAGPTPPELLLASLGSCAGHYAIEYLQTRSLPVEGLRVHASAEKGGHPAQLSLFRVEVHVAGIDERHRQGLLRAIKTCLIHNTLTHASAIEVEVSVDGHELALRPCTALACRAHSASEELIHVHH